MIEKRIGRGLLVISQGDITDSGVDAIVNAANNHLWMGAGVAGAIKRKGGAVIEEEAIRKGPIGVGEAISTGGGALRARYVIHAAGMGQDLRTSEEIFASCTSASLRRGADLGITSIAFPAIGTGVGGLALNQCARGMLQSAAAHLRSEPGVIERIEFVMFGEDDYQAFAAELENVEP
ncbi:MAG: macro domain-containing protein [Nitrospinota bacterium]|nr:macro domain-containing protein [Nitrospinota bacterium]MDP7505746.1 macro domain-containing protein [Nitrospinota bacterium]MDP7663400.1 macro domain-containing protein [Nitrospinota bacterium]